MFCNNLNQFPSQCLKVSNPLQRKKILRSNGLYFNWFTQDHLASKWISQNICRKWNGKHHINICVFDKKQNQNPVPQATTNNFPNNKK